MTETADRYAAADAIHAATTPPELPAATLDRIRARFGDVTVKVEWDADERAWMIRAVRPNGRQADVACWSDDRLTSARARAPRKIVWKMLWLGRNISNWYDPTDEAAR
jgi:hypothetical protein